MKTMKLVTPQILPPLDPDFRPAALANRSYRRGLLEAGIPFVISLERSHGATTRFETQVYPDNDRRSAANFPYIERLIRFMLWHSGGHTLTLGGSPAIAERLRQIYSPEGERKFDAHISETVYGQPLRIVSCAAKDAPPSTETGMPIGGRLDGCRIGFDLGASDRKASAVIDGKVVFSEEVIWEPRKHADPTYHYQEIMAGLRSAAAHMPRVDAIGGSSAGIFVDNRPMIASLFRAVPADRYPEVLDIFQRIQREMNVPLVVINDGDVTALAGSMSLEDGGVLGVAMGSSEAAGYIDPQGRILGRLNELAFAPIDYSLTAPMDEWSGDRGCGSTYFSQQCVFRLAPAAGIQIPSEISDAEKLAFVQEKLEAGHPGARRIWESIGVYFGYALAHYADFYEIKHVLILGRCTSGSGGKLILDHAQNVLQTEFPNLLDPHCVQLPDERSRRVGQSIAAAGLPVIV